MNKIDSYISEYIDWSKDEIEYEIGRLQARSQEPRRLVLEDAYRLNALETILEDRNKNYSHFALSVTSKGYNVIEREMELRGISYPCNQYKDGEKDYFVFYGMTCTEQDTDELADFINAIANHLDDMQANYEYLASMDFMPSTKVIWHNDQPQDYRALRLDMDLEEENPDKRIYPIYSSKWGMNEYK